MSTSSDQAICFVRHLQQYGLRTMFYTDAANLVGTGCRNVTRALGHIQNACRVLGTPPLQALVVNKKYGVPGESYDHKRHPYSGQTLKEVMSHTWDFEALVAQIRRQAA